MIEIIPAIDLIDGKCVRLTEGDFNRKTLYDAQPPEIAVRFEDAGLRRLHVVDLDGARTGKVANLRVLEQIAARTDLIVDFGGGIKTREDAQNIFDAGAKMISVGSLAVKSPETFAEWLDEFGGDCVLLGADARNGKIAVNGWQTTTEIDLPEFLRKWFLRGVRQAFCTDISRDGKLAGAAVGLYREIHANLPELGLIASGGISSMSDAAAVEAAGCSGVIIGKAIYESRISLGEIGDYLKNAGKTNNSVS